MKAERKQNVIIVCNKDKDAHPREMFNVQKMLKFIPWKKYTSFVFSSTMS